MAEYDWTADNALDQDPIPIATPPDNALDQDPIPVNLLFANNGDSETLIAEGVSQFMNAGQPGTNIMTGKDMPGADKVAAPTNTGTDANVGGGGKSLWQQIMSADPRVQAAMVTVGAGALSGAGAGYMTGKKQDDANKIAQQQVDINRQLAASQEALNKSKTSQDLSKFKFQQPQGLINGAQKPWVPAPFVSPTRRVLL